MDDRNVRESSSKVNSLEHALGKSATSFLYSKSPCRKEHARGIIATIGAPDCASVHLHSTQCMLLNIWPEAYTDLYSKQFDMLKRDLFSDH